MPSSHDIYQQLISSFPFAAPRPEQLAAFQHLSPWIERLFVQEFANPLYFGIDAPTGVGKSPLAISVALGVKAMYEKEYGETIDEESGNETAQVWVVTQNKLLQDQYQRDFANDVFDLRGLGNYQCYEDKGKNCGESKCGRIRGKKGESFPQACTFNCEYDKEKKSAMKAPVLSLNVAKALNLLKSPRQPRPLLMIFDEGHEVEAALDSEATMTLTADDLQKVGMSFVHYFHDLNSLEDIKSGMSQLVKDLLPLKEAEEQAPAESRDVKRYKKLEATVTKCADVLANIEAGIEYVSCAEDKLELKPLQVYKVFEKTFTFPVLFLSATLLSKVGFQSMTGLKSEILDWFNCTSPFPLENRPIRFFWRFGAQPFNYGNMQEQMPNLLKRVEAILNMHPDERGIIHTHTYKIAEKIYQELWDVYGSRLLFPKNAKEQKDMLEKHARSKNTVLLSPSMTQGVDLRDDLCRFTIMCKVPWLPTNDPVVKARMEMDKNWYSFKTAMTVVQAPGRGVRSATDFSETYLIDPGFARFFGMAAHHLPKWFTDSLVKKPVGTY